MAIVLNTGAPIDIKTDLGPLVLKDGQNTVDDDLWTASQNYYDVKNALEGGTLKVIAAPTPTVVATGAAPASKVIVPDPPAGAAPAAAAAADPATASGK